MAEYGNQNIMIWVSVICRIPNEVLMMNVGDNADIYDLPSSLMIDEDLAT